MNFEVLLWSTHNLKEILENKYLFLGVSNFRLNRFLYRRSRRV